MSSALLVSTLVRHVERPVCTANSGAVLHRFDVFRGT
jgi:hypothetical protein